jgi:Sulfotransferase domain
MKFIKHTNFFLFLLIVAICSIIAPLNSTYSNTNKKIAIISIPKSGTNLTAKAVTAITNQSVVGIVNHNLFDFQEYSKINKPYYFKAHLVHEWDPLLNDHDTIKVLCVRDLRDVCLSAKHWLTNHSWFSDVCDHSSFYQMTEFDKLLYMIHFPSINSMYSIEAFGRRALSWMNNPNVFVVRFEDLVGPLGGGNREIQKNTVMALATHLGYNISNKQAYEISDSLYGNSLTFRVGQIGQWKNFFSEEHKKLFKEVMGDLLIELSYEKDSSW